MGRAQAQLGVENEVQKGLEGSVSFHPVPRLQASVPVADTGQGCW